MTWRKARTRTNEYWSDVMPTCFTEARDFSFRLSFCSDVPGRNDRTEYVLCRDVDECFVRIQVFRFTQIGLKDGEGYRDIVSEQVGKLE